MLDLLAGLEPPWVLFGAGALIGFHLGHRTSRDLDLAFRPLLALGETPREVEARLRLAGLEVEHVQRAVSFARLRVRDASEAIELDLVADPTPAIEPPLEPRPGVRVETARTLLAQKLGALLSRTELRDLEDVGALIDAGGDLVRGLADAVQLDAGFSPPTLAWLLSSFPIARAPEEGRDAARLEAVRARLLDALRRP
ncbi:MAG: nucleotidyl transferase AbiEii/AbiGii toxin family protein [Kofleriaceae bacterium]